MICLRMIVGRLIDARLSFKFGNIGIGKGLLRGAEWAMRTTLVLLMAVAIFAGGCRTTMSIPRSSFLSKFSLETSAKQTAYKGIDNSTGPGGRGGGESGMGGGTIGPRETKIGHSAMTSFMIIEEGENKFEEGEFIEALASRIRKEIEDSHASITGSSGSNPNEFYIDYKDGNINGRITISGSAKGQFYVLKANVDESNKP
jgi:hypothetical protein